VKKVLSICLVIILLIAVVPVEALNFTVNAETVKSGITGECTWNLDGTVLTISGNGAMGDYYIEEPAPWEWDITEVVFEEGVTTVGEWAFADSSLTKVVLSNTITTIKESAFYYSTKLESIDIPDSVTRIEEFAFSDCYSLANITIGCNVTHIGVSAFQFVASRNNQDNWEDGLWYLGNHLIESGSASGVCTIKPGTIAIHDSAFPYCPDIESIIIPDSVKTIGASAFKGCSGLKSIVVDENNPYFSTVDGVLFNKNKTELLYYIPTKTDTSYTIPNDITSIPPSAFANCTYLKNIIIPNSVTSVGEYAFNNCSGLQDMVIPDSVTYLGSGAFNNCSGLKSIYIGKSVTSLNSYDFIGCESLTTIIVDEDNQYYSAANGVLFNKDKTELLYYATGKTDISYTIPDGVTNIAECAFRYCDFFESVTIPNSVISIGSLAFDECEKLKNIVIPSGVKDIKNYAFSDCSELTSVSISDTVVNIEFRVFNGSNNITQIVVDDNNRYYSSVDGILFDKNKTELIYYPSRKKDKSYSVPFGVTSICEAAFDNCKDLESVTIPDSVTSLGYSVFYKSSGLKNVTIGEGITTINPTTFAYCDALESITIPKSVNEIGYSAFSGCYSLKNVFYNGTEEDRAKITISWDNEHLTNASWTYKISDSNENLGSGDINGDSNLNLNDLVTLSQYVASWKNLVVNEAALDVNGDDIVNLEDVNHLARYLAGWDVEIN